MSEQPRRWTLITSHGLVLFYLAARPDATMRELSRIVGITERQVARIIRDLADAEMISVRRIGRRNNYAVNMEARFPHPSLAHMPVRDVLGWFSASIATEE